MFGWVRVCGVLWMSASMFGCALGLDFGDLTGPDTLDSVDVADDSAPADSGASDTPHDGNGTDDGDSAADTERDSATDSSDDVPDPSRDVLTDGSDDGGGVDDVMVDTASDVSSDVNGDPDGGVGRRCGDGVVDDGESCDDGDDNSDTEPNACRTNCMMPRCGDGVVDSSETCDAGDANNDARPDACRTDCSPARCGDGVTDSAESCDDGDANSDTEPDACRLGCRAPSCGDRVVDAGEECDAGPGGDERCLADCTRAPLPFCGYCRTDDDCAVGLTCIGWNSGELGGLDSMCAPECLSDGRNCPRIEGGTECRDYRDVLYCVPATTSCAPFR